MGNSGRELPMRGGEINVKLNFFNIKFYFSVAVVFVLYFQVIFLASGGMFDDILVSLVGSKAIFVLFLNTSIRKSEFLLAFLLSIIL